MNKEIEELVDLMFDTDMEELMKEKSTLEYIHKLQQENKQLKEELEKEKKYNTELMLCNSRFNAILTELKEWLKENAGICRLNQKYAANQVYGIKEDVYYRCLNTIQELKEKYK